MAYREEDDEEKQLKYQLAQFSFDMFIHALARHAGVDNVKCIAFEELDGAQKFAWEQSAWALKDLVKTKSGSFEKANKLHDDIGYVIYTGVNEIKKLHTGIVTYKKFPAAVKEEYRELAKRIKFKLEELEDET